jgi:hypothetical protein
MNALLREQPQWEELEALIALLPTAPEDAAFSAALGALAELRRPVTRPAGLDEADAAFDDMDYDLALRLYAVASPTRRSVARVSPRERLARLSRPSPGFLTLKRLCRNLCARSLQVCANWLNPPRRQPIHPPFPKRHLVP